MIPTEACLSCGSTRWKRDASGEFVCPQGHQYHVVEQEGENEWYGTHSLSTSKKPERKKVVKETLVIELKERMFRFQYLLKKQVYWLVEFKKYPAQLSDVVRDVWCIYTSKIGQVNGISGLEFEIKRTRQSDILPSTLSLVILKVGCSMLRIPLSYLELFQFALDSDFPFLLEEQYLNSRGIRSHLGSFGGYFDLEQLEAQVWYFLDRIGKVSVSCKEWNAPLTALQLFDLLDIPVTLYPHFRTIKDHFTFKSKSPPVGIICLFLSKFVDSNSPFPLIPMQYRERNAPIESIYITSSVKNFKDFCDPSLEQYLNIDIEEEDVDPIKPPRYVKVKKDKRLKSYNAADEQGKFPAPFANRVQKVSDFFGFTTKIILADLKSLEMTLSAYQ